MTRISACLLCSVALSVVAALATAQDKSHDALAHSRVKAKAENQRVLLLLTGGDATVDEALMGAMADYRALGKLLKYEYQLVALPAASLAGKVLRKRLDLGQLTLPTLAVLSIENELLGTMSSKRMGADGGFAADRVSSFLKKHACTPVHARKVLADGLATARQSNRNAFIYLSAPW